MAINEKNMTSGSPGKLIITFAIPLMLGNVFQQFYTMADTMIVGQVVGVEALAAVGAADWLVCLNLYICTIHSLNNRNNYEKEFAFSRIVRDDTAHRHFPCFCTRAE